MSGPLDILDEAERELAPAAPTPVKADAMRAAQAVWIQSGRQVIGRTLSIRFQLRNP